MIDWTESGHLEYKIHFFNKINGSVADMALTSMIKSQDGSVSFVALDSAEEDAKIVARMEARRIDAAPQEEEENEEGGMYKNA